MSGFARTDTSVIGRWWWTIDRWSLAALFVIVAAGALLILAASPPVAERIGVDPYHFVKRQYIVIPVAIALMVSVSLASPLQIRRAATIGFIACLALLVVTLAVGVEIKGARRWLNIGSFSLQPSEFVKPFFAVTSAWMFAEWRRRENFPGHLVAIGLYLLTIGLLLLQPDLGQTVVVTAIWFAQFFLAGLPLIFVAALVGFGVFGLIGAYFVLPHVASRIDRFLDPATGDTYQVDRSLEAFMNGGLLGTGPGEGTVKMGLPDAHADFIFSVAGEEFGAIACLLLLGLFLFVILRGMTRLISEQNLFILLAGAGLLSQFGLQALIHMASSLQLMPAKGMTLPFVSYGGSSLLALAIGMGMALALTRRRIGYGDTA